jgi:hypothetical protein
MKLILAGLSALALALGISGCGSTSPAATGTGPIVTHVYPAIAGGAAAPHFSHSGARARFVILQAWETVRLHRLKARDPSLEVLVYKNFGYATKGAGPGGRHSSGVSWGEAPASWFLDDTAGRRFTSDGYGWLYAMDVGNSEYQRRWAHNVISELRSEGWDGVFMDDVNPTFKYAYEPHEVARYPTSAAYARAVGSALAFIGPRITSQGKLAIANCGAWVEYAPTCDRWLRYLSGGLDEMFVKWGGGRSRGYRGVAQWQTQLEEVSYATERGKYFLGFTHGPARDREAARYGYATMLLGSEGTASYAYTPDYAEEEWFPEYEYDLGRPTSSEAAVVGGVHRRPFEHGLVLVNPTGYDRTLDLGGAYSGSGLTDATSVTMGPHTGLVLTVAKGQEPTS